MASIALISIILAAVYTLWMVQKVFYGDATASTLPVVTLPTGTRLMLMILVVVILVFGVYPQPMINLTTDTVTKLIAQIK